MNKLNEEDIKALPIIPKGEYWRLLGFLASKDFLGINENFLRICCSQQKPVPEQIINLLDNNLPEEERLDNCYILMIYLHNKNVSQKSSS